MKALKKLKRKQNIYKILCLALSDMFNEFQIQQDQDFWYKVPFLSFSIPREPEEQ